MSRQHLRHLVAITIAVLVTGAVWALVVPPFEGLDESYYYRLVVERAKGTTISQHTLFFRLAAPLLRLADGRDVPYRMQLNPAYRPGTGRQGEATVFLHDDVHEVSRFHVRQLYLLRALVLLLTLGTIIAAYELARSLFAPDVALLVAALCLFLPQVSFVAAKVHSDAAAILVSALAYWALIAFATHRLGRLPAWILLAGLLALAPLADREVYFLFLIIPVGLVAAERTLGHRLIAAVVIAIPALIVARFYAVGRFANDVGAWIGPFHAGYRGRLWSDEVPRYVIFEALPKVLFGFVGWFNASVLLPPWTYALAWDVMILAACGFVCAAVPRLWRSHDDDTDDGGRRAAMAILVAGVLCNVLPIVYTNLFIVRSPDARYFFPSLAAIMVLLVIGGRALIAGVQRDRRVAWIAAAAVVAVAAIAWAAGMDAWMTAGVAANHYGNQPHLMRTFRLTALGLALSPLALLGLAAASPRRRDEREPSLFGPMPAAPVVIAIAAVLNLLVLTAFVRPLYAPLDAAGYERLIQSQVADGDLSRASDVADVASEAHPQSSRLRELADELRFMTGDYARLESYFMSRLTKGPPLRTRAEYLALARTARVRGWRDIHSVERVAQHDPSPDAGEGPALLRLEVDPSRRADPAGAADVLRDPGIKRIGVGEKSTAFVEGFGVHPAEGGRCEVVVYYRPYGRWVDRSVWLRVDPVASALPVRIAPHPPQTLVWDPGELAWDQFFTAETRPFDVFFGVQIVNNPGQPLRLGRVDRCAIVD